MDLAALGIDGMAAVKRGIHATLSRCLHTLNLFKAIDLFHDGVVPPLETLPACRHRKLRLLFMVDPRAVHLQPHQVPPSLPLLHPHSAPNPALPQSTFHAGHSSCLHLPCRFIVAAQAGHRHIRLHKSHHAGGQRFS